MNLLARLNAWDRLMRLDKPIGILLLLWPTLWALWLSALGKPDWIVLWVFVLGTVLMCPPLSYLMQKYVLPKPGEGPSEKEMDRGFLRVTGHGTGSQGGKVRASLYFPTDPGYRDTARYVFVFCAVLWYIVLWCVSF